MEAFDQAFNTWLAPAGVVNSPEVVAARKAVALELRDGLVQDYDLVLAAFGELDSEIRARVEQRVQELDPTHTPGKKNLVELLCAAAVMGGMERPNDQATDIALLVSSASFRKMKPRVKALPEAAATVLQSAAERSRKRLAAKKPPSRPRQPVPDVSDEAAAIAGLSARLEQAIGHFDLQLQLLNEEVDILWWARSGRSDSGVEWGKLSDLERAVGATAEVSNFIVEYPVTGAVFEVLRGVVDAPKQRSEGLAEICSTAANQTEFPLIEGSRWLLPILSAIRIARTYPPDARAGVISAELGLGPDVKFKIADLPEQLLRELAILKRAM